MTTANGDIRKQPSGNRLRRILRLATLLSQGEGIDIDQATTAHACSRRSIYRDLSAIRSALDIKTRYNPASGKVYAVLEMPPLSQQLHQRHLVTIAVALAMAHLEPLGLADSDRDWALSEVLRSLKHPYDEEAKRLLKVLLAMGVESNGGELGTKEHLGELITAAVTERVVELTTADEVDTSMVALRVRAVYPREMQWWVEGTTADGSEEVVRLLVNSIRDIRYVESSEDLKPHDIPATAAHRVDASHLDLVTIRKKNKSTSRLDRK